METERNEGSLAAEAAARVQAIVAAAETSARQLRDDAERDAAEHVERVAAAARALLERIDALGSEVDRLRDGAASLNGSLDELRREAGALGRTAAADEPAAAEATEPAAAEPAPEPTEPAEPAAAEGTEPPAEPTAAEPEPPAPAESAAAPNGSRSTDDAGARLVALNMALEGSPRDATARYLAEQFELPDLDALLDDVYASAGK